MEGKGVNGVDLRSLAVEYRSLFCEAKDDSLPLDFGLLKIDQKAHRSARGSQIVETLRRVFAGEALGAFQFHHQRVLDKEVCKVLSHRVPLVPHDKRNFSVSSDAPKAQFAQQGELVNLLKKPAPSALDTSNTAPNTLSVNVSRDLLSAFICVHRRFMKLIGSDPKKLQ